MEALSRNALHISTRNALSYCDPLNVTCRAHLKAANSTAAPSDDSTNVAVNLNPFGDHTPRMDPGDGLPTTTPDEIEFKWDKQMPTKETCDTLHMLYLLQMALEMLRRSTIKRNQYFKSIGRTHRYITQLDGPQIITNLIR